MIGLLSIHTFMETLCIPATAEMTNTNQPDGLFIYTIKNDVAQAKLEGFKSLQNNLDQAAREFEGYLGQELTYEQGDQGLSCIVKIRFTSLELCLAWLDSRIRRKLLSEAESSMGYEYKSAIDHKSFDQWISTKSSKKISTWKINLIVWLALYPSVMLLIIISKSTIGRLSLPLNMLISNAITVALTGWFFVPWLSNIYQPWLEGESKRFEILGTISILILLWISYVIFTAILI